MKKFLLFFTALFFTLGVAGQNASQYPFSQPAGTYTAISGGTVLGTGGIDDNVYTALPIGFNFTFCGTVYTQFSCNVNGWLCMGTTASSSYTPISTGSSNFVVSASGRDLQGLSATGELRYQTIGTAPNQTLVLQWSHFQKYGSTGTGDDFSFQIRLNETSNTIDIVYDSYVLNATSTTVEVGLRGASNADFNNRSTTTNWSATTAGTINSASCTLSNTCFPASGLTFHWSPPPPCATPGAVPTALVLVPTTQTISGSFTASPSADSYLIIRSLNNTISAIPVDGTVYPVGSSFGGGIVEAWGPATTFVSTGLLSNTTYHYYIFAANNACIGTPPLYLTSSILTGFVSTLQMFPISGNKTVGPTGDFFTLTEAFAYLNQNGVNGALNLILQSTYLSSAEPAFPIPVLPIPGASAVNKTTVYPSVTGLSITSNGAVGTIYYNAANYVWFDGRVNATGTTPDLVIENTVTTGYSVGFANGACNNGLKYCIVKNVNTSLATGTIAFLGTTTTTGNNNNVIDYCDIRDGATTPIYVIFSNGSTAPALYNTANTISNCNIHDFYAAAGGNPIGVGMFGGSTGWTISGNSFYQTVPRSPTVANGYNVIFIASGDGYTITNNYIGGSAPLCGGTPWTLNGNGTPPTIANFIYAIRFQTGSLTTNASSVQGNTISNIALFTNPTAASIYFTGLISVIGKQNIGNITPNIIGSSTGTGSINITVGNGAYAPVYEGIDFRGMGGSVMNNVVGSIILQGPVGSVSTYALTYRAIGVTPSVQNAPITVSGNLVGSLTTGNSIQTPAATNPPIVLQGLYVSTTGSGTMTVSNNTIANLSNPNTNSSSYNIGLYDYSLTVPITVTNNTIRDMSSGSTNTTSAGAVSLTGIYSANSVPGSLIGSNMIYNLVSIEPAAAITLNAMYLNHTAGSLVVEKNFMHNIYSVSSSATSQVNGIYLNSTGAFVTMKNNMIQLGVNLDGLGNQANSMINGILEAGATRDSVLNNSIFIAGAPAGTTGNTYAFNSTIVPSLSTPRVYLNNIFYNARTGGTTGKHYGIKVAGTTQFPLGLTSNYNFILAPGAVGGVIGSFNAVDQMTLPNWKSAVGVDLASGNSEPYFIAPNGSTATANLHIAPLSPIEASGIALANVTDDFDGQARSGLTPPDIGADAGNFFMITDACGPNIVYVPLGNGTVAVNRPLPNWATITDNVGVSTGANLPRIYYKKSTDNNAFVGNTSADNGWKYAVASNSVSPFSFTIDYALLQAPVAAGDIIQYFVAAQDNANNLNSWYPEAGSSAIPYIQNINLAPTNVQSYTIVAGSIPTVINVPGDYATLTATGGAFDAINQGVLVGNTTINITADLVEPGTVALNAWSEDPPGSNYKLKIKADGTTLRTISGTATLTAGTGLIRSNGADRFTIDGGAGKYLTFRFTNATASGTGPTIQFDNGSVNDTVKNCTIENNGTSTSNGSCIYIGSTGGLMNNLVISGNDLRDATAGTAGRQATGIYSNAATNFVQILNNNIYNFINYGLYFNLVGDGAVITGNSFYYNSATASTTTQYCIYLVGGWNNHMISGNYFGGQSPLCAGSPWTNTTTNSIYGIYGTFGIIAPTTISNNTIQNFSLSNAGSASFYGMYITNGICNVLNNTIGSASVLNSISSLGTGTFYGIYLSLSTTAATSVQGNIISGLSWNGGSMYLLYTPAGQFKIGTVAPNVIGSGTTANAISYNGTGTIYGFYNTSNNSGNAIENNTLGNITFTAASGSPSLYGMYIYSANVRKNKIVSIGASNAALTPTFNGIYNYGVSGMTNEYSNNMVSISGGLATNPTIRGYYDNSYTASFYNLYYNAFYVSGPATTTSTTYAFYRGVAAFYTLNNNIFANTRAAGGTGKHYAAYISSTGGYNGNNNDLYSLAGPLGYYNGADQATLAAFQSATGGDFVSQNADPQFVSATDFHTVKPELNNSGVSIPAVTTDFSGAPRGNPPDIGLYEFSLIPVITTTSANPVGGTTATLNGSALPNGEIVVTSFEWGLTAAYGNPAAGIPSPVSGAPLVNFHADISGLTPVTLYHYRAKGVSNAITYNGLDATFTTIAIPADVVTLAATGITSTGATFNGTVMANNSSTAVTFEYGLTAAYGSTVTAVPASVSGMVITPVQATVSGLLPCTLYHFRVVGANAGGTANGNDLTFTTAPGAPFATTLPATGVGMSDATLNGQINANCDLTTVTFEYGLTTAYGTVVPGSPATVNNGNLPVDVSALVTGLTVGATYHYRVCGQNALGTTCGNDEVFTTGCPLPDPAGPISGPISVCKGGSGYIYSVAPINGAISYVWTLPPGGNIDAGAGSTTIQVSFTLGASSGNVSVAGNSGCALGLPSTLAVTVNDVPSPTVSGPVTGCTGHTAVYTTQAGFANYVWTVSAGGTIQGGNGTPSLTVLWNTAGAQNVTVNYQNAVGCGAPSPTVYPVTVNTSPVPSLTGPTGICVNSGYYYYVTDAGFSNYSWAVSPGGTITGGGNTNQVQIEWIAPGPQWVSVNYTNAAGCSAPQPTVFDLTVEDIPGAAGTISGTSEVCGGATGNYSVPPIPNTTTYVWSLPAGASITAGDGTNSITVLFAADASSGDVTVYGNNLCGNGTLSPPFPVTVTPLPDAAGPITGQAAVCDGDMGITYSVATIPNATGYTWSLPPGASIATGDNTNTITVDFAPGASSGVITVFGTNSCGSGLLSPDFSVIVNPIPPTPVITLSGYILTSDAPSGNQWYKDDVLLTGATGQTHDASTTGSGWYWTDVTLAGCTSDTSNHIYVLITGMENLPGSNLVIYPVPSDGLFTLSVTNQSETTYKLEIYNVLGVRVYADENVVVNQSLKKIVDLRGVSNGVYTVILRNENNQVIRTILIHK